MKIRISCNVNTQKTNVHRMACPLSASSRRNVMMAQADWESRPDVGSSRKRRSLGYGTLNLKRTVNLLDIYTYLGGQFNSYCRAFFVFNPQ
jgi:hypothetical protein